MSDEGHKRHEGPRHDGEAKTSPYPISRLAPTHDLVDVAREIQQADAMLGTVAENKLKLIADQIRGLQAKARALLEETQKSSELHRVRCNFKKRPGATYHLYARTDGTRFFSMLSPQEWGSKAPHEHLGSYRLGADMSFTDVNDLDDGPPPIELDVDR